MIDVKDVTLKEIIEMSRSNPDGPCIFDMEIDFALWLSLKILKYIVAPYYNAFYQLLFHESEELT